LWYHSNEGKEIVGIATVSKEAYPDATSDNPKRVCVDVVPYHTFSNPITLEYIKTDPKLADMMLLRQQRLSVSPVSEEEFEYIQNL
jgi:predicted RNA-binding protein with PUA-like domain